MKENSATEYNIAFWSKADHPRFRECVHLVTRGQSLPVK